MQVGRRKVQKCILFVMVNTLANMWLLVVACDLNIRLERHVCICLCVCVFTTEDTVWTRNYSQNQYNFMHYHHSPCVQCTKLYANCKCVTQMHQNKTKNISHLFLRVLTYTYTQSHKWFFTILWKFSGSFFVLLFGFDFFFEA